jgi:hypothetical protein
MSELPTAQEFLVIRIPEGYASELQFATREDAQAYIARQCGPRVKLSGRRKSAHYTNFGISLQPREADATGFLWYREGFQQLPETQWTAAEAFIAQQEARIEAWRGV